MSATFAVEPTVQADLFALVPDEPAVKPERVVGASLREQFDAFHGANPWVAATFERMVADELERGATKVGIGALTEVLRWHHRRKTKSAGDALRINNNHRAFYARLLIDRHPEWAGVIETRTQKVAA